ncbi:hypothetical protein VCCP1047_3366, partial [Vibrio cholerae CP1047(20)]
ASLKHTSNAKSCEVSCQNLQRSRLSWPFTAFPTKKHDFSDDVAFCETKLTELNIQRL